MQISGERRRCHNLSKRFPGALAVTVHVSMMLMRCRCHHLSKHLKVLR